MTPRAPCGTPAAAAPRSRRSTSAASPALLSVSPVRVSAAAAPSPEVSRKSTRLCGASACGARVQVPRSSHSGGVKAGVPPHVDPQVVQGHEGEAELPPCRGASTGSIHHLIFATAPQTKPILS